MSQLAYLPADQLIALQAMGMLPSMDEAANLDGPANTTAAGVGTGTQLIPAMEEPLYVNAKQYRRILKRREQKARWESAFKTAKLKVRMTLCTR